VGTQDMATRRQGVLLHQVAYGVRVDTTLRQVRGVQHGYAQALRQRQILNLIRGVVAAGGNDGVSRLEVDRAQRLDKARSGIGDHRDVTPSCLEQGGDSLIAALYLRRAGFSGFVASEISLEFEMGDGGMEHGRRHQRGAGVVQVYTGATAGSIGAPLSQASVHR
jgi:hypothetical protein